ncbi:MAG: hypothetical protein HQL37_12010 [Alphaproteobacteria bacterium]|nr:hypothetical protein [Alphaproteobacteria bacterium]
MPVIPKLQVPTAQWSNLRQVLQWLADEIVPVETDYEISAGINTHLDTRRCFKNNDKYWGAARALDLALLNNKLTLYGRAGIGDISRSGPGVGVPFFDKYGDPREAIGLDKIREVGFWNIDFDSSYISCVQSTIRNCVLGAWQYIDVVTSTADLLEAFPPSDGRSIVLPFVQEVNHLLTPKDFIESGLKSKEPLGENDIPCAAGPLTSASSQTTSEEAPSDSMPPSDYTTVLMDIAIQIRGEIASDLDRKLHSWSRPSIEARADEICRKLPGNQKLSARDRTAIATMLISDEVRGKKKTGVAP